MVDRYSIAFSNKFREISTKTYCSDINVRRCQYLDECVETNSDIYLFIESTSAEKFVR